MEEVLFRVTTSGEGELREKGSRFYAYAYPIRHLDQVDEHLQALKKTYHDARHHCYAYRLGAKGNKHFSTDDREPSGSAGPPILAALRSASLTDTLVVVVRYFGGTKLGIRGLIEAYRSAAERALEPCERVEIIPRTSFFIQFNYDQTSEVNRVLHRFPVEVLQSDYTQECQQQLSIRQEQFPHLQQQLVDIPIRVHSILEIDV